MGRKLRMGMIGGGPGSFIGAVHHKAAALDAQIELVAGAFSSDPKKSRQKGAELGLDPTRAYGSWQEMIVREKALPAGKRIDFVAITTPNNSHFAIAKGFLEAGFHVMCEKPMTFNLKEAVALGQVVKKTGKVFGLMHNYVGYPMVKLARDLVRQGDLGAIRKIVVVYPQGWLALPIERDGQTQASWRTDPKRSGAAGAVGDIGTHCENLAEYITGCRITELCADLTSFVKGRRLDDDGNVLLRFNQGARGVLHCSQIAIGEENGLAIWVYGTKAGLEWHQEHPNQLLVKPLDGPVQVWNRGNGYVGAKSPAAGRATRLPFGHPEAFIEAFANHYVNFADTIRCREAGKKPDALVADFPQVADGIRGMAFIAAVVASSKSKEKWTKLPKA